jgi:hypothetical protein
MTLIAHGVPWSVAWRLEEYEIIAMIVAIGEAEGGVCKAELCSAITIGKTRSRGSYGHP